MLRRIVRCRVCSIVVGRHASLSTTDSDGLDVYDGWAVRNSELEPMIPAARFHRHLSSPTWLRSCFMPHRIEGKIAGDSFVNAAALQKGTVPHFHDYVTNRQPVDYVICIPSFNRPNKLCTSTLALLRRHGVNLRAVHVFVAPSCAPDESRPEWHRYSEALREHGFEDVHVEPGGDGLCAQMTAIMAWTEPGTYLICLSDDVDDIDEKKIRKNGTIYTRPLPSGTLPALFSHAWDLMTAGCFTAWGLNAPKNTMNMNCRTISRKLGLLEGNLYGLMVQSSTSADLIPGIEVQEIFDVALTLALWTKGERFFRYRGLSTRTTYKAPGGFLTTLTACARRLKENEQIRLLSCAHGTLLRFKTKPTSSLKTMQYEFRPLGPTPLTMRDPTPVTRGRRYEGIATRAMTPSERQRKRRRGMNAVQCKHGPKDPTRTLP